MSKARRRASCCMTSLMIDNALSAACWYAASKPCPSKHGLWTVSERTGRGVSARSSKCHITAPKLFAYRPKPDQHVLRRRCNGHIEKVQVLQSVVATGAQDDAVCVT